MPSRLYVATAMGIIVACSGGDSAEQQAPPSVEIIASTSSDQVELMLSVANLTLQPAGTEAPNSGHHHLFVDRAIVAEGEVIPAEEGIVHLGAAQTSHVFEGLEPGQYQVIAVLGDYLHVRIPGSKTDTVVFTVEEPGT